MLASGGLRILFCGFVLCIWASAFGDADDSVDITFIEYLGLWEDSDEEWILFDIESAAEKDRKPRREAAPEKDPDREARESVEADDEV